MSRWIDADMLIANCDIQVGDTTIGRRDYVMLHEIDSAPSIDIVRCGECIHNGSYDSDCPFGWKNGEWNMPKPCDYCSYGEREDK